MSAVDADVAGPFRSLRHPRLGHHPGEHVFFYRVPTEFTGLTSMELHGATNGVLSSIGVFEVRADPQIDVFGDLDPGNRLGREFGLRSGSYVGFVYEPHDAPTAHDGPTTDTLFVTAADASGAIRRSRPFVISVGAEGIAGQVQWSPRSRPNVSDGLIDITRLDAFTGSTYLPTGEVVFEVSVRDVVDSMGCAATVSFTQPVHGTLVAFRPQRVTLTGDSLGDAGEQVIRLVYTPATPYRTDPSVHIDGFTFEVDDGYGGVTVTRVPVLVTKEAIVHADVPYLGNGSFSGRVEAPFGDVQGYLVVATVVLTESIGSMIANPRSLGSTPFGSVVIDTTGSFTYTRDPDWADLPVGEIDDSFAVIAYTADNQWASAVVPVGGRALTTHPSIADVIASLPTAPAGV